MDQLPHQTLKKGQRLRENGEPHEFTEMTLNVILSLRCMEYLADSEMQGIFYNVYNQIIMIITVFVHTRQLKQRQVSTQTSIQIGVIRLQEV